MDNKAKTNSNYIEGYFRPAGKKVRFKDEWSGHRFTISEINDLLDGEDIEIDARSRKTGLQFVVVGKLALQSYNGRKFYGFKPDFSRRAVPLEWGSYSFDEAERDALRRGEFITVEGYSTKGNQYVANLTWSEEYGIEADVQVDFDY